MSESLYWWAHELFETGGTCKSMLIWEYDPYAHGAANGSDLNFESYLRVKAQMIEEKGYLHAEPRAAISMLLSLAQHFKGPVDDVFLTNLHRLIDRSNQYLAEWNETVSINPEIEYKISALIFAHMQHALLEDAVDENLPLPLWKRKAKAFLEFGNIVDPEECFIWKSKDIQRNSNQTYMPDLLIQLVNRDAFDQAEILLSLGYQVDDLLRYLLAMENWKSIEKDHLLIGGLKTLADAALQGHKIKPGGFAFQISLIETEIDLLCSRYQDTEEPSEMRSLIRSFLSCYQEGEHKEAIQALFHTTDPKNLNLSGHSPGLV